MVVADHEGHVGLDLVEVLAQDAHGGDVGIELREILAWRAHKKLRRVNRSKCRYDLTHVFPLIFRRRIACNDYDSIVRKPPRFVKV